MTFVLIPGAWSGAWIWEPVANRLRGVGHDAYPITLSGLAYGDADVADVGLATHVEDLLSLLEKQDLRDAIVVGHSYSGLVAGQVADRAPDLVSHTVFVDAFLPHDGSSMLDAFPQQMRDDELAQIAENAGRWPAPEAAEIARERDLSAEQARWLAGRLVGHPGRTVSEPADLERPLATQRATCILSAFEESADVEAMRGEPGWAVYTLEAGHWPMVSVPGELAALLAEVASERQDDERRTP